MRKLIRIHSVEHKSSTATPKELLHSVFVMTYLCTKDLRISVRRKTIENFFAYVQRDCVLKWMNVDEVRFCFIKI